MDQLLEPISIDFLKSDLSSGADNVHTNSQEILYISETRKICTKNYWKSDFEEKS